MNLFRRKNSRKSYWTFFFSELFLNLKINHTPHVIEEKASIFYENITIQNIIDILNSYNIQNIYINLKINELISIPLPAIGRVQLGNNLKTIIIKKITQTSVFYYSPLLKIYTKMSIQAFSKSWDGKVILLETNEYSGEENYIKNKRKYLFDKFNSYVILLLIGGGVLIGEINCPNPRLALIFNLKLIGAIICFFILQKELGQKYSFIEKLCKSNSFKFDCSKILTFPSEKLFNFSIFSKLSFVYFWGGITSLILTTLFINEMSIIVALLTLIAFSISLYSVYLQFFVIKSYCPLCLGIIFILWLEFIVILFSWDIVSFSFNTFFISVISYGFTMVLGMMSWKNHTTDSSSFSHKNNWFITNKSILIALTSNSKKIKTPKGAEMILGNKSSSIKLNFVLNLNCKFCKPAFESMQKLLFLNSEILLSINFSINYKKEKSIKIIKHFTLLYSLNNPRYFEDALSFWFQNKDAEKLFREYPINELVDRGMSEKLFNNNYQFFQNNDIAQFPSFFLNKKLIPYVYSPEDIKILLAHNNFLLSNI